MGKRKGRRRGRGEGSIRQLPSGNYQAALPGPKRPGSTATFATHAEALDWIRKNAHRKATAGGTLGDWIDQWLPLHKSRVAPITHKNDKHTVEKHVRPHLGAVRLRDLTPLLVERFYADLHAAGVTQGERHKTGKILRNLLNAAVKARLLDQAPTHLLKIPSKPDPQVSSLTAEQAAAAVSAAEKLGTGPLFRLWFDTGLRPGELLALQVGDFDPDAGTIAIRRALCRVTKGLKELKTRQSRRTLPLDATTVAALAGTVSRDKPDAPLFPSPRGNHWWPTGPYGFVGRVFDPLVKAVGFHFTPYTVRHTMASLLLAAGVNIKVVSERLGHRDIALTLRTYAHLMPNDQRKAAEVMGRILNAKPPGK